MNIRAAASLALGAITLLCGCTPRDAGFGDSVRTNIAAQTITPDPVYEGDALSSGAKAVAATERYRTDTVQKPQGIKTTSGVSGAAMGSQ